MLIDYLTDNIINNLSKSELYILQYIYKNASTINGLTIRELSKKLNVSTTTIMRFCKKINLSGYSELKYLLKKEKKNAVVKLENNNPIEQTSLIVENTLKLLKETDLQNIIQIIKSNQKIHLFCGSGISSTTLDYLESLLFFHGKAQVYRYESSKLAFQVANNFKTNEDVLFIISTSGKYSPSIKMASIANTKGIDTIAITPFDENPISNLASLNLRFFNHSHKNGSTEYHSRLAIFAIINTIFKFYNYLEGDKNE